MQNTIRVQKTDGSWLALKCEVIEATGESAEIYIPEWRGTWAIHRSGMVGNVGGNDWRIYDLHPDDCARLCAVQPLAA